MMALITFIQNLFKREEGQTFAEYALILFIIVIAVIVIFPGLATALINVFQNIITALTPAG